MATRVKLTLTHYRRPERTHEAFMKWIIEEHLPLAIPVFKRCGVLNYSLVSFPPSPPLPSPPPYNRRESGSDRLTPRNTSSSRLPPP